MFDIALLENSAVVKVLISALVVAVMALARAFAARAVLHKIPVRSDERRAWLVRLRNFFVLLTIAALVAIWADALRTLAVSALALAVAFVIATKEVIQSVLGALFRTATNAYTVGDRIEIGAHRGDVIDQNLFTTTIMEVGPTRGFHLRTGRVITFPNNKLLDTFVVNESYMKHYVIHVFPVPVKTETDWERAEKILLTAAEQETSHYIQFARQSMKALETEHGLDGLPVQPRINIQVTEPGKITLLVRIPAPVGRQGRVEQAILRRFLREYYSQPQPAAGSGPGSAAGEDGVASQPDSPS